MNKFKYFRQLEILRLRKYHNIYKPLHLTRQVKEIVEKIILERLNQDFPGYDFHFAVYSRPSHRRLGGMDRVLLFFDEIVVLFSHVNGCMISTENQWFATKKPDLLCEIFLDYLESLQRDFPILTIDVVKFPL